jgi:hypothetical protein
VEIVPAYMIIVNQQGKKADNPQKFATFILPAYNDERH